MKLLALCSPNSPILEILEHPEDEIRTFTQKLSLSIMEDLNPDWVISYGYPFIIQKEILDILPNRFINLHISYLPWNRGYEPDLWSVLEDSPQGVSIHLMDESVDGGDIIAQIPLDLDTNMNLGQHHNKLHKAMLNLFTTNWPLIRNSEVISIPQSGKGSFHRAVEKKDFAYLLQRGESTPINEILAIAKL